MTIRPLLVAVLALASAPACIGAAGRPILAPPCGAAAGGFPPQVDDREVWLEARFHADHEERFGQNLLRYGLLPIAVRIGLRPAAGDSTQRSGLHLDPATLAAELILQDGTALSWEPTPRPSRADPALLGALAREGLELSLLPPIAEAREGFLFFRFDPDRVRVRDAHALSRVPGAERELSLFASLLRIEVRGPGGTRTLSVGLQPGKGGS